MHALFSTRGRVGIGNTNSSRPWGGGFGILGLALLGMLLAPSWSAGQVSGAPGASSSLSTSGSPGPIPAIPVTVIVGRSAVYPTTFSAVKAPVVSNEKVCTASQIGAGSIVINGLLIGTSQVSVAEDGKGGVATYLVRVVRDADDVAALARFINANVPGCQITLTLSPDTRKVILGGYVWTQKAIEQVNQLLIGPDLPQADVIYQWWWAYPPTTTTGYRGR